MLKSLKDLKGKGIEMKSGDKAPIMDFLTDDVHMTVRYIVVDAKGWLPGRKVLVSTETVGRPRENYEIPVSLTMDQIKNGPIIEKDKQIDRKFEQDLSGYYGWKPYWENEGKTQNLISMEEIMKYHLTASDGEIGHAEDLIIDDSDWTIRYMVVDMSNWNPAAKRTLISTNWIKDVNMKTKRVDVIVNKEMIKGAPEYDPEDMRITEAEKKLHAHYKKPALWTKNALEPQIARM